MDHQKYIQTIIESLPGEDAEKISALRAELLAHNAAYYDNDAPTISDYEYDMRMQALKQLEAKHPELADASSPSVRVGGTAKRKAGVLVPHNVPMLSLQDVFERSEVDHFVEQMRETFEDPEFVVEYKIDGLSLSLRYENGVLVRAVTRGDGVVQGEDVTENARVIPDVIQKMREPVPYIEIRGEVYMTEAAFERVNARQEAEGKQTFANPRNCAAGTLRQLDSAVTKERGLSMFVFNIQEERGAGFSTHTEGYEYLKRQGVPIIEDYTVCRTVDEVWEAICRIGENRGNLSYDIDGAVVKLNSYAQREEVGATSKVPRWAVAYKYPPEEKEAQILDIECSVGRTGRITPTAVFTPVRLCGTSVSRATLHNQDYIDALDVGIGDTVLVYKSGEIIPKVSRVLHEKRPAGTQTFHLPTQCPACGAVLVREQTADLKCVNPNCPAQRVRTLINFVSRDAMDIKGFGTSYIEKLSEEGYLNDIADIYVLKEHRDALIQAGLIGKEKNTDKLLQAIEDSKTAGGERLLTGLGIPNIGKAAAKALLKTFGSVEEVAAASVEALTQVEDIGLTSAQAVRSYFDRPDTAVLMERLKTCQVSMKTVQTGGEGGILSGTVFVITGTLPGMDRKTAQRLIEEAGGKVTSSVSKKTNYLLAGENAGSKLDKANALGVPVISLPQLQEMLVQ